MGWLGGLLVLLVLTSLWAARVAAAQEPEQVQEPQEPQELEPEPAASGPLGAPALPVAWAERPLTLTGATIRADGDFRITRLPVVRRDPEDPLRLVPGFETVVALGLGAGYGITEDLEVGAQVVPLRLSPDVEYRDPSIYGMFRFVSGFADVAARLSVHIPFQDNPLFEPGLPIRLHLDPKVRLDTGLFLPIAIADRRDDDNVPILSLRIPVELSVSVVPEIFLGGGTALFLRDLEQNAVPVQSLGIFVGHTVPAAAGPLADLLLRFDFPMLVDYGAEDDVVETGFWRLTFQAHVHFNH